jgi:hypothetical protein
VFRLSHFDGNGIPDRAVAQPHRSLRRFIRPHAIWDAGLHADQLPLPTDLPRQLAHCLHKRRKPLALRDSLDRVTGADGGADRIVSCAGHRQRGAADGPLEIIGCSLGAASGRLSGRDDRTL